MKEIACYMHQFAVNWSCTKRQEGARLRTISIRLSDTDYEELSSMLDDMGQTKQTFYESYTKTALRERRIPFIISAPADPFYSETNMNRLRHSFRQAEEGKIITKTMEDLEAMAGE